MSHLDKINPLTLKQRLCCLLAVTDEEAEALIRVGKTGADTAAIARRVGLEHHEVNRIVSSRTEIENTRIDANKVTHLQLNQFSKLSPKRIRLISEGRPYFSLQEFEEASNLPKARIEELFTVPDLEFRDKVTKKRCSFEPVFGSYIARPRLEFESPQIVESLGFTEQSSSPNELLRVIVPSETEAPKNTYELKQALGGQVFPIMRDEEGFKRYFVPAMIDLWFRQDVTPQQALTIINELDLRIRDRRIKVRYYQVELNLYPSDLHVMAATLAKIQDVNECAEIAFAEPTEVGFEDFGPNNQRLMPDFESVATGKRGWSSEIIELEAAHTISKGSPKVTIFVIDSGIRANHQDLSDSLRPDWNTLDLNFDINVPEEELSPVELNIAHGTEVASIISGRGGSGEFRIHGIAPKCWLLPIKVSGSPFGQSYGLRAAAIRESIDYLAAGEHGVLNLSWSTNGENLGVREALFRASEKGFAIVTSAGNYHVGEKQVPDKPHYPSKYAFLPNDTQDDVQSRLKISTLISVAATNASNKKASYSYFGTGSVTISAPGGEPGHAGNGVFVASTPTNYSYNAGTSFAAPHVTGVIALLWSEKPDLSAQRIISVLQSTSTNLDNENPSYTGMLGSGLINARAALESLGISKSDISTIPGDVIEPSVMKDELVNINAATIDELDILPYIGEWSARIIVAYRLTNGPFATIWDLTRTRAIDHWSVDQIKTLIIAGSSSTVEDTLLSIKEKLPSITTLATSVNINTATIEELHTLPLIGKWSATRIVAYRNTHGTFSTIWDLTYTGAVDGWIINHIKDFISAKNRG